MHRKRRGRASAARMLLQLSPTERQALRLDTVERRHVHRVLAACDGDRSLAARLLGVSSRTLRRLLGPG